MLPVFVQLGLKMNLRGHNRQLRWVLVACNRPGSDLVSKRCILLVLGTVLPRLRTARRKIRRKLTGTRSIDSHRDIRADTVSNRSTQRFVCSRFSTRPRYSLRCAATRKQTCRRRLDKNQFQRNCVKGRRLGGSRTWEEIERISNLRHAVPRRIQRRWRKDDYAERNVGRQD